MRTWKVRIDHESRLIEIIIQGKTYSEAYIAAEIKYPGCVVRSVSEMKKEQGL